MEENLRSKRNGNLYPQIDINVFDSKNTARNSVISTKYLQ